MLKRAVSAAIAILSAVVVTVYADVRLPTSLFKTIE